MFNFLTVLVFLPLEVITSYLYHFSGAIIGEKDENVTSADKPPDILKALTKPFTKQVISLDKKLITAIAKADTQEELE